MQTTSLALDHLLRAIGDPELELRGIGPGHAEFHRAVAIRAAAGVLAKTPQAFPAIAGAIQSAHGVALPPETRAHLAAAQAWMAGNPVLAASCYASILERWPRDLLALRLLQSCYFFLGWHERFFPAIDAVMPAWAHDRSDFEFVLAMAAFAHAENGDAAYAEVLGRKALANDPACPMGVHAVAHAIAESGRDGAGAQWLRDQFAHWAGESRMRTHNAWHLAMFDAGHGHVESALGIFDTWLLPASTRSQLDACDATALLWRIPAGSAGDDGRWRKVSDAFELTLTPAFWPYVDLHAGLAHLAAGQTARLQRLTQAIERCAEGADFAAARARRITRPGLRALNAWAEGRHGEAAALLAGLQPLLIEAGGSRVQLEIFDSIAREAVHQHRTRSLGSQRVLPAAGIARPHFGADLVPMIFEHYPA
ncbi:MAG TPA: hypothetical protein VF523_17530 [Burkholderiales bacterium]